MYFWHFSFVLQFGIPFLFHLAQSNQRQLEIWNFGIDESSSLLRGYMVFILFYKELYFFIIFLLKKKYTLYFYKKLCCTHVGRVKLISFYPVSFQIKNYMNCDQILRIGFEPTFLPSKH